MAAFHCWMEIKGKTQRLLARGVAAGWARGHRLGWEPHFSPLSCSVGAPVLQLPARGQGSLRQQPRRKISHKAAFTSAAAT